MDFILYKKNAVKEKQDAEKNQISYTLDDFIMDEIKKNKKTN